MARPEKYKPEQVAKAIKENRGILSAAAAALGCEWNTIDRYRRRYATVREACKTADETMIDFTEQQLFRNISDRKEASIFFYLKTKAKHRGYIERSASFNFDIDWASLTDQQLLRIAAGEDIASVLSDSRKG